MNEIEKSYGDWVAVDWGNSNLRYWVLKSNKVIKHDILPFGTQKLKQSEYESYLIKAIGKMLVKNNIYFAGVDFVQEKLIGDINVTSPTGLAAYKDLSGINLAKMFWNNI